MRSLRRFTIDDLCRVTQINRNTIASTVRAFIRSGHVARDGATNVVSEDRRRRQGYRRPIVTRRRAEHAVYRLVQDIGVEPPRITLGGDATTRGQGAEQLWRTMRMLRHGWTVPELAATASTKTVKVSVNYARAYTGQLRRAGYVRALDTTRFRLVRNTGPKPPVRRRRDGRDCIFDPNLDAFTDEGGEA